MSSTWKKEQAINWAEAIEQQPREIGVNSLACIARNLRESVQRITKLEAELDQQKNERVDWQQRAWIAEAEVERFRRAINFYCSPIKMRRDNIIQYELAVIADENPSAQQWLDAIEADMALLEGKDE